MEDAFFVFSPCLPAGTATPRISAIMQHPHALRRPRISLIAIHKTSKSTCLKSRIPWLEQLSHRICWSEWILTATSRSRILWLIRRHSLPSQSSPQTCSCTTPSIRLFHQAKVYQPTPLARHWLCPCTQVTLYMDSTQKLHLYRYFIRMEIMVLILKI